MRRPARRIVIGAAAGIFLALAAATGVSAYWQAQQTIEIESVGTGDLSISASWANGTPAWAALYPTDSTPPTTIRVSPTAEGENLVWKLKVVGVTAGDFAAHTTFRAWVGGCEGTPIPAEGAGPFTASTTRVDICVRYTLNADAPNSLQGKELTPDITFTAEQVSG